MKKFYEGHLLGWLGAFLIFLGYYLNANEMIQSWLVWIAGNLLVGIYCLNKKAYPTAAMSFVLVIFNFYGYFSWK
jgi:nicotinamide riboside transporter PnuC